jgi:predicted ribosomally synthesized peptide with nif11-like leader
MSWSELERLVQEGEADAALRRALKHCRSTQELVLAARRLGYRITRVDLQRARQEERQQSMGQANG